MNNKEQDILDNVKEIRDAQQCHTDLTVQNEDNSEHRHSENCDQHIRTRRFLWVGIFGLIGVIVLGVIYVWAIQAQLYSTIGLLELERVENAELKTKVQYQSDSIIGLHNASLHQEAVHSALLGNLNERSEALTDHIMTLNQQLDAKDKVIDHHIKTGKRYREF